VGKCADLITMDLDFTVPDVVYLVKWHFIECITYFSSNAGRVVRSPVFDRTLRFLVQGPVDNFVHNRKSESPAFYPVFIVMLLQQLNDTTFNKIIFNKGSFSRIKCTKIVFSRGSAPDPAHRATTLLLITR